jgi:hypothetical protein
MSITASVGRSDGNAAVADWWDPVSVDGALIDLLELVRLRQYLYLIERLGAVQALPMMNGPVFKVHFKAKIVLLKKIGPSAEWTHDRVHSQSSDLHPDEHALRPGNEHYASSTLSVCIKNVF